MSIISSAIERKKEQSHQMAYMFRVELPDLGGSTGGQMADDGNASFMDRAISTAANVASGRGNFSGPAMVSKTISDLFPSGGGGGGGNNLDHRVFSVDAPFNTFETFKNMSNSSYFYTAAHNDIGSVSMKIDEMEDGATLKYIKDWQKKIMNDNGTYNLPVDYKKDIKVIYLSVSTADLHILTYQGYFPTEIAPVSFDFGGDEVQQYSVTFTGDNLKIEVVSASDLASAIGEKTQDMTGNSATSIGNALETEGLKGVAKEVLLDRFR